MSYILDALRRADAERERERGAVPDLHAQPSPALDEAPRATARRSLAVPVAAGAAALALIGLVVWLLAGPSSTSAPGASLPSVPPPAAPAAERPAPPPPTARDQAPPPRPAPRPEAPPDDVVEPSAPLGATTRPAPGSMPRPAPRAAAPTPAPGPAVTPAPSPMPGQAMPNAPAPPAAGPRVYQLHELPASVRSSMPQLGFGGSMYSDDARSRMLIVNGQVMREGDGLIPGLRLLQIRPKTAVFELQGYRVEIAY